MMAQAPKLMLCSRKVRNKVAEPDKYLASLEYSQKPNEGVLLLCQPLCVNNIPVAGDSIEEAEGKHPRKHNLQYLEGSHGVTIYLLEGNDLFCALVHFKAHLRRFITALYVDLLPQQV